MDSNVEAGFLKRCWTLLVAGCCCWSSAGWAACVDTNPPTLACPGNVVAFAIPGQCSRTVTFTVTATNRCDPSPTVTCNPSSGSSFPVGKTIVNCTARDASSNTANCTFTVTVFPAEVTPSVQWQQSFGGSADDFLVAVQQTSDGGYVLGGTSYSAPSGNKSSPAYGAGDFWVIRLDSTGNKQWEQSYGGSGDEVLFSLQQTADGGFILAGASASGADGTKSSPNYGGYDYWVVRLDAVGNQLWDQTFGGYDDDGTAGVFVRQTSDGGFIVGGDSRSGPTGSKIVSNYGSTDFWVLRLDSNGNEIWEQSFGGAADDVLQAVQQTGDGGFILGGYSASVAGGNKTSTNFGSFDFWLVRLNPSGTKVWEQTFGGGLSDQLRTLQVTSDGGFAAGGGSSSAISGNKTSSNFGSSDFWLTRLDSNGNKLWDQALGGSSFDEIRNLQQTTDGGFILGGASSSSANGNKSSANFGGSDYWVVRVDGSGNRLWEMALGGTGSDNLYNVKLTRDGGYVLAGYSSSGSSGNKTTANFGSADFWVVKLAGPLPVINAPTGIVAEATSSNGAVVLFSVTATNTCQPNVPVSCSPSSGSVFPLGTNLVNCIAVDALGVSNRSSFPVVVLDRTPPSLACPANIMTNVDAGQCLASFVNLGAPIATDASGSITVTNDAPAQFGFGVTRVTWTAIDRSGNTSVCTQMVTVAASAPVITCPGNFNLIAPVGQCSMPLNFSVTASDACDPAPVITCVPPSGSIFPVGKTTVFCTAQNAAGIVSTCSFTVSVFPVTPAPAIQWQQTFGGGGEDLLQSIAQTSDGGFLLGGHSSSGVEGNKTAPNFGSYDYWVVRVNAAGNKVWEQSLGGSGYDTLTSVQAVGQNGFILGGTSASPASGNKASLNFGGYDYWVVRLDNNGNKIWEKEFGGSDNDWLYSVQPTSDGGFIFGGWSVSSPGGSKTAVNFGSADFWVVRTDSDGKRLWDQTFGGIGFESLYTVIQTRDGGFLLGGTSASPPGGNKISPNYGDADFWIVRLDPDGNKLWDQSYGGSGYDALFSMQETADGGFVLGGYSASGADGTKTSPNYGDNDYWIVRIDSSGNQLWDKSFGGIGTDGFPTNPKIQLCKDGGFVLGGQSASAPGGTKTSPSYGNYDYWLLHLDSNGNAIWEQAIGGAGYDALTSLMQTPDGGYALGGVSYSDPDGRKTSVNYGSGDFWLVKLTPNLPTIFAPTGIVAEATSAAGAAVNFALTATNTCQPNIPVTSVPASGAVFPLGTNLVTATAVDGLGVTNTSTFPVLVRDTTPPSITAPPALLVNCAPGVCYATNLNLGVPIVSDNSGFASVTNNAPAQFPRGGTVVTWIARDGSGNTNSASQAVTVQDNAPPSIIAPPPVVTNLAVGQSFVTNVILGSAIANDNCGSATITNDAPNQFPKGVTTVTWTARDGSGNLSTALQTVTVKDNNSAITAPPPLNANTATGVCYATNLALGSPIVCSNCGLIVISNDAPVQFAKGVTVVTWTARDTNGNVSSATQAVTVQDTAPPLLTAPGPVTNNTAPGLCYATNVILGTATFSDNCGVVTITNDAPSQFTRGITMVTWNARDSSGNISTAIQMVTVQDKEIPTISAPGPVQANTSIGQCYATNVALGAPTVSDNCGTVSVTNDAPNQFPKGITLVIWTALDASGNTNSATQTVTVEDSEPPQIAAPTPLLTNTVPGQCYAMNVSLGTPVVSDNCSLVTISNDAPSQFPKGVTTVTWTAHDLSGNSSTATQTVTVKDTAPPIVTAPAAVITSTLPDQCFTTNLDLGTPVATDNCGGLGLAITNDAPTQFFKGLTLVRWTAYDASGNLNTATQMVTVLDLTPPTILACASNRTIALGTNCSVGTPDLTTEVSATDNCDVNVAVIQAPAAGTLLTVGTNIVTLFAIDASSNASMCSALIILSANPPVANSDVQNTMVNQSVNIPAYALLGNDLSPDQRPLLTDIYVGGTSTNGGQVQYIDSNIVYTPPTNYTGSDAFNYTNHDCAGLIGIGQVLVTINAPLKFISIATQTNSSGKVVNLQLSGTPGANYTLQRASQLSGGISWSNLAQLQALPSGSNAGRMSFTDTNPPAPAFYRAKQP